MRTESNIRVTISKGHGDHTVRSLVLDKERGIKALYCIDDKTLVRYLYRKTKGWEAETAATHALEHFNKFAGFAHISVDQAEEFLRVVGEKHDGGTVNYQPNSPSFILSEKIRWESSGGGVKDHNHGILELDEEGNGESKPGGADNHKHEIINFTFQRSGPEEGGHIHELGGAIRDENLENLAEGSAERAEREAAESEKSVTPFQDLPLAPADRVWDGAAAAGRVRSWAGGPAREDVDFGKYRKAFFFRDDDAPENFTSYKLGYADVVGGELKAVLRGVRAVFAVLRGARGGVDIPQEDKERVMRQVIRYLKKFGVDVPEDTAVKSVEEEAMSHENIDIIKVDADKRIVYGIFLWPERADLDGDVISHADVEKVAHGFMADFRDIDEMHNKETVDADIVESAISWKDDLDFHGKKLSKGVWFGAIHVNNDAAWEKVKNGVYKGFSVRIRGVREPI